MTGHEPPAVLDAVDEVVVPVAVDDPEVDPDPLTEVDDPEADPPRAVDVPVAVVLVDTDVRAVVLERDVLVLLVLAVVVRR